MVVPINKQMQKFLFLFRFSKTEKKVQHLFLRYIYILDKHYDKWSGGRNKGKVAIKAIKSGLCCVGLIKGGNFVCRE